MRLVDTAPLSVRRCLKKLKLPKSTYYRWLHRPTLQDHPSAPKRVWNRLRDEEATTILVYALEYEDLSPRELAFKITDEGEFSVSESTVYRLLKRHGLTRRYPRSSRRPKSITAKRRG